MPDEPNPLDTVNDAVTAFANAISDGPVLVNQAVIVWEEVSFDDNGDTERSISYANTTDNFSLSGALGLLEAGREFIRRDILGDRGDDD